MLDSECEKSRKKRECKEEMYEVGERDYFEESLQTDRRHKGNRDES